MSKGATQAPAIIDEVMGVLMTRWKRALLLAGLVGAVLMARKVSARRRPCD